MTIFWTALAKLKLQEIYDYYFEEVGFEIAEKITSEIVRETLRLIDAPYIGQKELLLEEYPNNFRYLVYKNYKIIYWINEKKNRIDIANVFDCRQDPNLLKQMK